MPIRWEQPFRPGLTIAAYLERCRQASLTEEERVLVLNTAAAMKALGGSPVGPIFELFLADHAFRVRTETAQSSGILRARDDGLERVPASTTELT
jgi:hypothetical protein